MNNRERQRAKKLRFDILRKDSPKSKRMDIAIICLILTEIFLKTKITKDR